MFFFFGKCARFYASTVVSCINTFEYLSLIHISLKALQNDSVNAAIKRMSVEEEHSGFELKKLSLKIIANDRKMRIENFAIDLPNTSLAMDTIRMEYDSLESLGHFTDDVRFSFRMPIFIFS